MSDGFEIFDSSAIGGNESQDGSHLSTFLQELNETIQNLENTLIDVESSPSDLDKLNHTFRLFHNLKGSSSMMECNIVKEIAHYSESLLQLARSGKFLIGQEHIDLFLESISALKAISSRIKATGKEGEERYFLLLHRIVEHTKVIEDQIDPSSGAASLKKNDREPLKSQERKSDEDLVRVSRSVIEQMMLLVGEFMQLKNKIHWLKRKYNDREYYDNCQELDQFSAKLQRNILKLRLSPVRPVLHSMRRVVRTTANQLGKKIEFEISGEETMLDRSILDILSDPLMHIIRNAIDHGIEDNQSRKKSNKPDVGHVSLKASYRSGEVHVSISDDGKGLDGELLKRKAVEKGLLTPGQVATMSSTEANQIIFLAGFSGAEKITETSGRGVGMDVVKEAIQGVGGQVDILTEVGTGTTFTIRLPLSLAIVECLGFKVGEQMYAIPQLNVEEVLSTNSSFVQANIKPLETGGEVYIVRNSPAPILPLAEVLDEINHESEALIQVRHGRHRFVLKVSKIIGPISIVSQPLPPTFATNAPFSGVTKQGDGSLLFQLDVGKLFKHVESKSTRVTKSKDNNRGEAGTSQEGALLSSSDIRRLQQKTIVFKNNLHFCIPVQRAKRIVFVHHTDIKEIGKGRRSFVTLEGNTIPLIWVEELLLRQERIKAETYSLLIFQQGESVFGIPMIEFLGIERMPEVYDENVAEAGILGSTVIGNQTILSIDLPALVQLYHGIEISKQKTQTGQKKVRILCAEDDKFFSSELKATLSGAGYETIMFTDGLYAKEALLNEKFTKSLDIVVTDIEMPRMTGIALCRWIKATEHTKHIPVIAYTAITTEDMKLKMLSSGAVAFISKMAMDDLLQSVNQVVNGKAPNQLQNNQEGIKPQNDRVVTFQLGRDWFALPMQNIKEVSPVSPSANIPKSELWLKKVTDFRGTMVPVLDLQQYFGLGGNLYVAEQAVLDVGDIVFALKVGKIGEVLLKNQLRPGDGLPNISSKEHLVTSFVSSVYEYNSRVISLLNPGALATLFAREQENNHLEGKVA